MKIRKQIKKKTQIKKLTWIFSQGSRCLLVLQNMWYLQIDQISKLQDKTETSQHRKHTATHKQYTYSIVREREIYIYRIEINAIDVSFTFFYRGLSEGLPEPQPAHHEIYGVTISNTYASPKIKNKHNIDEYNPAFLAGRLH